MSERDWICAAWHAASEPCAHDATRVVSTDNGVWVIACQSISDMSKIHQNLEILYKIQRYDALRALPPIKKICAVPALASAGQARHHALMRAVRNARYPEAAQTMLLADRLAFFRRLPIAQMPESVWFKLCWQFAVDVRFRDTSRLEGVIDGLWMVRCYGKECYEALGRAEPEIMRVLCWLRRYRSFEVVKICRIIDENRIDC